ncbi:MAG: helix-turn-helix transcriptional regulator [Ruminiclostridium sp.]|mgnify:CR=1 FL=1|nr:helix-turn-helix transcriptional regulator [Ruminiclostridium sp.]
MTALGNKQIMADNIAYYMSVKGVDRNQLCDDLNFKYSTVSEWLAAKKYPRIDKIEIMAEYFGITKSDLIEERNQPTSPTPEITDSQLKFALFGDAEIDDDVLDDVKRLAKLHAEMRKQEKNEKK